jgi:AraC family transcriptional regulator of arabinose operon
MCFRTPAMILTVDGLLEAAPGDCIVHSPEFRHFHYTVPGSPEAFRNDWLHADGKTVKEKMKGLELPWNKLIKTGRTSVMSDYIKRLLNELETDDEYSTVSITNILHEMLISILRASRENIKKLKTMSVTEREYYERFKELRAAILEHCEKKYTVKELAHKTSLSPERFSVLYKKFFKSSPISEIIDARVSLAKRILAYSAKSIKETATECGFEDLHYFSRIFKQKTGISPSEHRNNVFK